MSKNGQVDAYVLSESSMFVSQRRFILKTCGITTPLECISDLVSMAKQYTGFDTIEDIFYSRKNFERPDLQLKPHRSFEQEVALLDEMFADGAAYCLGTLNRYYSILQKNLYLVSLDFHTKIILINFLKSNLFFTVHSC